MDRGSTSEQLLAEMAWVRRLARALVGDPPLVSDVAPSAWIRAAEKPRKVDRPLWSRFRRIEMALARTRKRGEQCSRLREQAATNDRSVPSSDELVERLELQRIVAGEVLALAEPYRPAILLHFLERCTCAEIARRIGTPAGMVWRRLDTALVQLRAALRARPGQPPEGWLGALVRLCQATPPSA